jgi:hypothetical protein
LKTQILLCAVALASLVGCGGDNLCEDAQNAWNGLNNKSAPCGYSPVVFSRSSCDQNVKSCNDTDKNTAKSYFDCLNRVGTCNTANQNDWAAQVTACGQPSVSNDTCANAINPQP